MIERRKLLSLGIGGLTAASSSLPTASWAKAFVGKEHRRVSLHNLHTGENLAVTYWEKGAYIPGALHEVNHVLRDYRTGESHPISPKLLDLLHLMSARMETLRPYQVISGYRSARTNAILEEETSGVAHRSLHMDGKAIDIRAPGINLARLHKTALSVRRGGVGYYPASDFVHVDVGPVRRWG